MGRGGGRQGGKAEGGGIAEARGDTSSRPVRDPNSTPKTFCVGLKSYGHVETRAKRKSGRGADLLGRILNRQTFQNSTESLKKIFGELIEGKSLGNPGSSTTC